MKDAARQRAKTFVHDLQQQAMILFGEARERLEGLSTLVQRNGVVARISRDPRVRHAQKVVSQQLHHLAQRLDVADRDSHR